MSPDCAGLNLPEGGGDGSCEDEAGGCACDSEMLASRLGSRYGCGNQDAMGGRRGDAEGRLENADAGL